MDCVATDNKKRNVFELSHRSSILQPTLLNLDCAKECSVPTDTKKTSKDLYPGRQPCSRINATSIFHKKDTCCVEEKNEGAGSQKFIHRKLSLASELDSI